MAKAALRVGARANQTRMGYTSQSQIRVLEQLLRFDSLQLLQLCSCLA